MSAGTTDVDPKVRDRLLQAWRGEIEAGRVYDLIAERMPDREAEILRRMAEAEGGHRRRLETRMTELVGDLYKRSTGDPVTDELLWGIRKDERAHSLAVNEMRSGVADGAGPSEPQPPPHPAQVRLDKILGREK